MKCPWIAEAEPVTLKVTPMKITLFALGIAYAAAFTHPLHAQKGPPAHAGQGMRAALQSGDEMASLEVFLTLSDEELDKLLAAITRVRKMSPEERREFTRKIVNFRQLPENSRRQVREQWGWLEEADRNDWRLMMQVKSEAERSALQAELQALPPEKRAQRKHELLQAWRAQVSSSAKP